MGFSDNLADNNDNDRVEDTSRRVSSASDLIPTPTPAPTMSRLPQVNHPAFSFSRSSRSSRTTSAPSASDKPRSRPSSQSVSPAKPSTGRAKASAVFHNTAIAGSSHPTKQPTKPSSPLAPFNLSSQSTRPATSDVTASLASGVIVQPPVTPASPTPTIASSNHGEISSTPMHTTGFDTIVEGEEVDLPMDFRGNPSAFKDSPMARLLEQYTGETSSNELSTETSVTLLVTMVDLEADNIEKIEDPNRSTTKYRLSETLLENLSKTTVELQLFVERAAGLLEERDVHFTVDPHAFVYLKRDHESTAA